MLSKKDKKIFEDTMERLEEQLIILDYGYYRGSLNKKDLVDKETDKIVKALVKDIKKEPRRVNEQTKFINKYIPEMKDIIDTYKTVEKRTGTKELKDRGIEKRVKESIEKINLRIKESYLDFNKHKIEDLKVNIKEAKEALGDEEEGNCYE